MVDEVQDVTQVTLPNIEVQLMGMFWTHFGLA